MVGLGGLDILVVVLVVTGAASGIRIGEVTGLNTGGEGVRSGADDKADRLATAVYKNNMNNALSGERN